MSALKTEEKAASGKIESELITYDQALLKISENISAHQTKQVRLKKLHGHVLAESVVAKFDSPAFDNSAVDGFGVRCDDLVEASDKNRIRLRVVGEMKAGAKDDCEIEAGTAVKILTGARVPHSAEAVVMREFCTESEGVVLVGSPVTFGENVRKAAAEFKAGEVILEAGLLVTPPVVGLIASLGYKSFEVYARPKIAIVTTGDELIAPGNELEAGQIYDSNSYALRAAAKSLGIKKCSIRHTKDSKSATMRAFRKAFAQADIVISSGGVSAGDYDYVKDVLEEMKVKTIFWRIAVKPGKPVYFGVLEEGESRKFVFGLPGNPVSSLVTFHQFVKPAILRWMGLETKGFTSCKAALGGRLSKRTGRLDFVRGLLSNNDSGLSVKPTVGQDSHMLTGLARANSLIHFDADAEVFEEGRLVDADLLDWNG